MANVDSAFGFRFKSRAGNPTPPLRAIKVATSGTFASGDPLAPNSYGYFDEIGSAAIIPHYIAAEAAASEDAGTEKLAIPIYPDMVWEVQCSGAPSQTMIGTFIDIEGSTGVFEANEDASTNDTLVMVDFADNNDDNSTANARILVTFNKCIFAGAASA